MLLQNIFKLNCNLNANVQSKHAYNRTNVYSQKIQAALATLTILLVLALFALSSETQAKTTLDKDASYVGDVYTKIYYDFYNPNGYDPADIDTEFVNEFATAYAITYATAINEGKSKDAATAYAVADFVAKDKAVVYTESYAGVYDKAYSGDLNKSVSGNAAYATIYATAVATATASAYATAYDTAYASSIKEDANNIYLAKMTANDQGTDNRYSQSDKISSDASAIANAITAAAAAAIEKNKANK